MMGFRLIAAAALFAALALPVAAQTYPPVPPGERLVGIAYGT